jgi:hypothetical protein
MPLFSLFLMTHLIHFLTADTSLVTFQITTALTSPSRPLDLREALLSKAERPAVKSLISRLKSADILEEDSNRVAFANDKKCFRPPLKSRWLCESVERDVRRFSTKDLGKIQTDENHYFLEIELIAGKRMMN